MACHSLSSTKSPNHQNGRVCALQELGRADRSDAEEALEILVRNMMSYRGLSDLQTVPRWRTVTAGYHVDELLQKTSTSAMQRRRGKGRSTDVKLLPDMSTAIFQQDGARVHHARKTQNRFRTNLLRFWEKGMWPGNSPDLSPTQNL